MKNGHCKLYKSSYFYLSKLLNRGISFVFLIFICALAYLAYTLLVPLPQCSSVPPHQEIVHSHTEDAHDFDAIALGPLSLERNENEIPIPDVHKHIVLYALNDRFDVNDSTQQFTIGIRGNSTIRHIRPGERVDLGFTDINSETLKFEDIPSPIWMRINMKAETPIMEVGLDIVDEMGEKVVQNRRYFKLKVDKKTHSLSSLKDPQLMRFATILGQMNAALPDQLYEIYAPKDEKRGKYRIQTDPLNPKSVIFVKLNSKLFFDESKVVKQQLDGPVAQVIQLSKDEIGLQVWNASGLEKITLQIPVAKADPISFNIEDAVKRVRKRTVSSVSCLLGNKNTQLKKGDWAIHTKMGWKVVKKPHDLLDVIHQNVICELFVFDTIEKSQGKYQMVGHLFDKSRSNVKRLYIPFAEMSKKTTHRSSNNQDMQGFEDESDEFDFDDPNLEFDYFDFDF